MCACVCACKWAHLGAIPSCPRRSTASDMAADDHARRKTIEASDRQTKRGGEREGLTERPKAADGLGCAWVRSRRSADARVRRQRSEQMIHTKSGSGGSESERERKRTETQTEIQSEVKERKGGDERGLRASNVCLRAVN